MRSSKLNCSLAVEFTLVQETILLQNERITQLYVTQSEQDPFLWFGVLFVDTGIYMGAVIRFTMFINDSYPNCPCPKVVFNPIPYHPLVDPQTGELDTKNAFPAWNSNTHKLHQLLLFVKRVMCQAEMYIEQIQELISQHEQSRSDDLVQDREVSLDYNDDLDQSRSHVTPRRTSTPIPIDDSKERVQDTTSDYKDQRSPLYDQSLVDLFTCFESTLKIIRTYKNAPDEFQRRVDGFKQECCHRLFDKPDCGDDKNALVFSPWEPEIHEPIRSCVLAGQFAPPNLFASYHKETESVLFVPGSEANE